MAKKNQKQAKKPVKQKGQGRKKVAAFLRNTKGISRGLAAAAMAAGPSPFGAILGGASGIASKLGFADPIGPGSGTVVAANAPVAFGRDMNYRAVLHQASTANGLVVHTMDYFQDMNATTASFDYNQNPASIVPLDPVTFPLASLASQNYRRWRPKALRFHYEHQVPTSQAGMVYLYFNPDVAALYGTGTAAPVYTSAGVDQYSTAAGATGGTRTKGFFGAWASTAYSVSAILNSQFIAAGAVYEDLHLEVDLAAAGIDPNQWFYNECQYEYQTSVAATYAVLGDARLNSCGFFQAFYDGVTGASGGSNIDLGKLWVEMIYELESIQLINISTTTLPAPLDPALAMLVLRDKRLNWDEKSELLKNLHSENPVMAFDLPHEKSPMRRSLDAKRMLDEEQAEKLRAYERRLAKGKELVDPPRSPVGSEVSSRDFRSRDEPIYPLDKRMVRL